MINYDLDRNFLTSLNEYRNKTIWAKVIALDLNENAIEEIIGKISVGGSVSIDGASSVRRSCSFTMVAQDIDINNYYWGLKTKFQLFVGVSNEVDPDYENIV